MPNKHLPKQGDMNDRRCGLIQNRRGEHKLGKDDLDWCPGCKFYVCEECAVNHSLMGNHDIMEHLDSDEEEHEDEDE